MDAPTTLASTQAIVIWTMFALLLAWMVIFAVLAFCPPGMKPKQSEEYTAPTMLQVIASPPVAQQTETRRHDNSDEMEAISVR